MVKAWKETVTIPTYEAGEPEKNPIFLEKRVYQGSSGVVYPYPVIESISDEKHDKEYNAVFLENEYLKIMILPELGGRVQMAYDKVASRHFIYYNRVVKPALVGLTGPWISGGIEFNWPQHHRPSTFMPVDCTIEENGDGSVTVWCNEMERMFHQKGMMGFTLRPGCAFLEIKGIVYNRTEVPQTFLWWANPAVKVNDAYQSVFPPDVNAVFDHGFRAVSTFPIATGEYYKVDYSAGVDISNYKNIPVPTSYMIAKSRYDFEGGYENDSHGGMLHVANHHVSPGKKQWTWGNGDFGRAWDRNLTDEDGPYIELMAGVFTSNQPDFTWLMPYEEKSFVQYFLPYRELGIIKNASRDFALNMEDEGNGRIRVKVFATSARNARITVKSDDGTVLLDEETEISPERILDRIVECGDIPFESLEINAGGLSWHAGPERGGDIPEPAKTAPLPSEAKTCEELYLTGLHLEQYRHATWSPVDYYEEAIRREPDDIRCNNALGLWYIRKGLFQKAEKYLRTAVKALTGRNPNPYDGEPIYNLALCLKWQEKYDEAYDLFYKATWNAAWQDAGYFACAQISARQGRWLDALDELDHCLARNWHNHKARALKASVLRHLGREQEALMLIEESLKLDLFNYGCRFEGILLGKGGKEEFISMMRGESHNYDELALDYMNAGLEEEADKVWLLAQEQGALNPMSLYYWGRYAEAEAADPECCFPNRLEAVIALNRAMEKNPDGAKAPYYLGNLYYDKRQYGPATALWEKSAAIDPSFPTVWRNLALAWYNKYNMPEKALKALEKAFSLDETDSRILMELDQLYKKLGRPHAERLAFLQKYPGLLSKRDDLLLEEATLLNLLGQHEEASRKIGSHKFHPWEGGEGKVTAQYQFSRVQMALKASPEEAIRLLEECLEYPENLGEGKLCVAQENDFHYLLGCAYEKAGNRSKAEEYWEMASKGNLKPVAAMYYNDAQPDKIFYQGLALRKLGQESKAEERFRDLLDFGKAHLGEHVVMDYFAVSLPDLLIWEENLDRRNDVHCHFMMALGEWGLGNKEKAMRHISEASALDPNHIGIASFVNFVNGCPHKQAH